MEEVRDILNETIMLTGFVMVMMLVIEFLNVRSRGKWNEWISRKGIVRYLISGMVCAVPGCLGPYLVVSLYAHNIISFGALLTGFITSVGDESYVMLSLFPSQAAGLIALLFITGLVSGYLLDRIYQFPPLPLQGQHFEHNHPCPEINISFRVIRENLAGISFPRFILIAGHLIFLTGIVTGYFSEGGAHHHASVEQPGETIWITITFAMTVAVALFIVMIVPDHFLEKHLWDHIIKKHFLRIFLWTVGILSFVAFAMHTIDLKTMILQYRIPVMLASILIGYLPVSGPHLIFVSLYAQGMLPFSILLTNSLVQDGHGSIPLIAESKRAFIFLKLVKTGIALLIGGAGMMWNF